MLKLKRETKAEPERCGEKSSTRGNWNRNRPGQSEIKTKECSLSPLSLSLSLSLSRSHALSLSLSLSLSGCTLLSLHARASPAPPLAEPASPNTRTKPLRSPRSTYIKSAHLSTQPRLPPIFGAATPATHMLASMWPPFLSKASSAGELPCWMGLHCRTAPDTERLTRLPD